MKFSIAVREVLSPANQWTEEYDRPEITNLTEAWTWAEEMIQTFNAQEEFRAKTSEVYCAHPRELVDVAVFVPPPLRITMPRPRYESRCPDPAPNHDASFEFARLNDSTVARLYHAGHPLERIIGVMAQEKVALFEELVKLKQIAPRRVVKPDGQTMIWRCPDKDVPTI